MNIKEIRPEVWIGLSAGFALAFFFGWVLPTYPYTRRITMSNAGAIVKAIEPIALKKLNGVNLTPDEAIALTQGIARLVSAGYYVQFKLADGTALGNSGEVVSTLVPPPYASSSSSLWNK